MRRIARNPNTVIVQVHGTRRNRSEDMGHTIGWIVAVVVVVGVVYTFVSQWPDLRRYMKMRSM